MSGCKACRSLKELLELKPDYVAEAASVELVKDIAVPVLESGANLVVLSIGAFADPEFYERVQAAARKNGTKVHIASGIETRKGPGSLRGTPVFEEQLMTDTEETHVFSGNAREAIGLFPTKVNVAAAAALADIYSSTSAIAGWSVAALLRNLVSPHITGREWNHKKEKIHDI